MQYGQPRRLNAVTVTILLALCAAGYWFWRIFPAYFDGWTVDHILKETAAAVYRTSRLREPERSTELKNLVDKARTDIIKKANVSDPDLLVNLDIEGTTATLSAKYDVRVMLTPFERSVTLHFLKKETADIKVVSWD